MLFFYTMEVLIGIIVTIALGGGAIFAYKKNRSNKVSQRNITIQGGGKVVGGDDNSTIVKGNKNKIK